MKLRIKKEICIVVSLVMLLFFPSAYADDTNQSINEYDSIYRYNALENKLSFFEMINAVDNTENLPKEIKLPDNVVTKLQEIIKKQDFSTTQIEDSLKQIKDVNKIKTFLIGNNLGTLKFQVVQTKDIVSLLKSLSLETTDNAEKIQIDNQIDLLKKEQKKAETVILDREGAFSLFGWFIKIM